MNINQALDRLKGGDAELKAIADAIEQAMREPVAKIDYVDWLEDGAVRMIQPLAKFGPGTKLFAFPPDAAGEIERLRTWVENVATDAQLDAPVSALGGQTGRQLLSALNTEAPHE